MAVRPTIKTMFIFVCYSLTHSPALTHRFRAPTVMKPAPTVMKPFSSFESSFSGSDSSDDYDIWSPIAA